MSDNHEILKLFTRKLANCRYKVPVSSLIKYMDHGQFGYEVKEGEDTVVTNESVFADSITSVIMHIRAIFKDPHIFLKKEELVQNVAVATHINNEMLRMNYKDSKLWKTNIIESSPEYVHTFVYEDDYAIYENRFICFLIDLLSDTMTKKINELKNTLQTLNWRITNRKDVLGLPEQVYVDFADEEGGVPVILASTDNRVGILNTLIKNKKNLTALKQSPIYKACQKAEKFNPSSLRSTNILIHDKHYFYCYDFYLHYLRRETEFTTQAKMYNGFVWVNLFCALDKLGFKLADPKEEVIINNSAFMKFTQIKFVKEPFEIVLKRGEKEDVCITVTNLISGSTIDHMIQVWHSTDDSLEGTSVTEQYALYKKEYSSDERKVWLVSDVEVADNSAVYIQPQNGNVINEFIALLKKFTLLAEGALSVYARVCPVCGASLVTPVEKDYSCIMCGSLYHLFYYETRDLIWVKRMPKIMEEGYETEELQEEPVEELYEEVTETVEEPVEETPAVETTEEKTDEFAFAIDESRIKRSFLAKLSHLEDEKKEFYNELKNYILTYKNVSDRISWNYESFNAHREARIRLAVRGKTLVAFFALNPKDYEDSKYFPKDMGEVKRFEDTPMMVKVKSERGVKYAKELVDIVLADMQKKAEYTAEDYFYPYKSDKQLFEEGLIKITGEVELSDEVRESPVRETVDEIVEETAEETVETVEEVIEETVEEPVEIAEEPVEETTETVAEEVAFAMDESRIKRSFLAKLSHLEDEKKEFYNELKNYILTYKNVSDRISWNYESFNAHRETRVRLAVRGKTLVALFALNPKDYEDTKYFPKDMGGVKRFEDTPMMVKVKSERGVKYAKELVEFVLADLDTKNEYVEENYFYPYKSDKQLLEEGLIKITGEVELSDEVRESVAETVQEPVETVETPVETVVEKIASESVEETPVNEFAFAADDDASRIKRHFLAKISQIDDDKKGYYSELKNHVLQYKKVSARASWNYETFSSHRQAKVRLAVRGKTLVAFFALNPKDYEDSKYFPKDMSDTKRFADTPMMVKVKSSRGVKYAKELIDIVLLGLVKDEKYVEADYKIIRKSDKELFAEGLIKINGDAQDVQLSDEI